MKAEKMTTMKTLNWNELSELGLIERINREILHPLGLAMSRNPGTGHSECVFVSDDGVWEYSKDMESKIIPDSDIIKFVSAINGDKDDDETENEEV